MSEGHASPDSKHANMQHKQGMLTPQKRKRQKIDAKLDVQRVERVSDDQTLFMRVTKTSLENEFKERCSHTRIVLIRRRWACLSVSRPHAGVIIDIKAVMSSSNSNYTIINCNLQ